MEVNPRLWQWHGLARACGVDLPRIAYEDALGHPPAPVESGPEHDGQRWAAAAAHLRFARDEKAGVRGALGPLLHRGTVEATWDWRDPLPAAVQAAGLLPRGAVRAVSKARGGLKRSLRDGGGVAPVKLRIPPPLDVLLLLTVFVTTWHKIHWSPAGQVTLEDIFALLFLGAVLRRPAAAQGPHAAVGRHRAGLRAAGPRGGLPGRVLRPADGPGARPVREGDDQVHAALRVPDLRRGPRRAAWRAPVLADVGSFVAGITVNAIYGVLQLLAKVGGGVNLDAKVIGPLTQGQGGVGGINVFGQATAVQNGQYVSQGVFRVNALALDPNHLGIMLDVPILLLLPFALRLGIRSKRGLYLSLLIAFLAGVQVLTLSRSGYFGLAFGLLVLAIPLRRQLLSPRLVVPVAICLVAAVAVASQSHYVRTVYKSRVTVSDRSAQVHYQIFALVPPVLSLHPWLGLGLNTFSVYYEFETGRTDWGPHSFYVALIAETGLIGTAAFGLFLLWLFLRLAVLRRCAEALRRAGDPREARAGPCSTG